MCLVPLRAGKTTFLLLSLPDTYANVVDHLFTKKATWDDAYAYLLDFSSTMTLQSAAQRGKTKQHGQKKSTSSNKIGTNECTVCRTRNRSYVGHTYKTCTVLKDFKNGAVSDNINDTDDSGVAFITQVDLGTAVTSRQQLWAS